MSHTVAPWSYTPESPGRSFYVRDAAGHQLIWLGDSSALPEGENEANARLISAAPCLLEALINLVKSEDDAEEAMRAIGVLPEGGDHPVIAAARAAITKATGIKP